MSTTADRFNRPPDQQRGGIRPTGRMPCLSVRPATLHLVADRDGRAAGQFTLVNEGQGLLSGTVVSRPAWLRLNVHRFVGNCLQVYAQIDPTKLTASGELHDLVVIESNGGTGRLAVTCEVKIEPPGQQQVNRPAGGRPLLQRIEATPETEFESPLTPLLRPMVRSRQLILAALFAGLFGITLLVSAVANASSGNQSAEAAPLSQPPAVSVLR